MIFIIGDCMPINLFKRKTRVVRVSRAGYDVCIARPSIWGNPFVEGKDGTRAEVIAKYEAHVRSSPHLLLRLNELRGKVLGCYCAPKPCHGDVLVKLVRERFGEDV